MPNPFRMLSNLMYGLLGPVQKAEFDLQRAQATRAATAKDILNNHDATMRAVDAQSQASGLDAYDTAMARYARRAQPADEADLNRNMVFAESEVGVRDATDNLTNLRGVLRADNDGINRIMRGVNDGHGKGRGAGAFFGRIATGRFLNSSRAAQEQERERATNHTGFITSTKEEVWKLQQREADIRAGTAEPQDVINMRSGEFGVEMTRDARDQAEGKLKRVYGPERDQTLSNFQSAVAQRTQELDNATKEFGLIDRDFFPGLTEENKTTILQEERMGGLKTLPRGSSRVPFAQLYMFSKGHSLESMLADTPEASAMRQQCGREFMEIATSGDRDRMGTMLADMGNAFADMPIPDMTSDAALYQNMREIDFMRNASINFSQVLSIKREGSANPREAVEEAYRSKLTPEQFRRNDNAIERAQATEHLGVTERLEVMGKGDYAFSAATEEPDYAMSRNNSLASATAYSDNLDIIKQDLIPGERLADGRPLPAGESGLRRLDRIEKTSGKSVDEIHGEFAKTITTKEIAKIDTVMREGPVAQAEAQPERQAQAEAQPERQAQAEAPEQSRERIDISDELRGNIQQRVGNKEAFAAELESFKEKAEGMTK